MHLKFEYVVKIMFKVNTIGPISLIYILNYEHSLIKNSLHMYA